MENSIEKDEEILNNIKAYMQENIDKGYHKFVYNDLGHDEKCVDVINAIEHILRDYKRVLKENEELKERNEYYISKSVIQDKIEEIINNSTFGCVGCEWNDIEVVQLLENMLLDRRDK